MATTVIILQQIDTESVDLEELILAQAELKTLDIGYQDFNMRTPDWIIDKLSSVGREIHSRVRGELERQLKTRQTRMLALRSRTQERKDLAKEIEELEEKLA